MPERLKADIYIFVFVSCKRPIFTYMFMRIQQQCSKNKTSE